jgi:hypothetical protein
MRIGLDAMREQYQDYRKRLDARAVLERYGARNCSEQVNIKDGTTEIVHSCLIERVYRHHNNGDSSPSAWCNIDKGLYVCASFWSGDLMHLVQILEGKATLHEALPVIGEMLRGATLERDELKAHLAKLLAAHEPHTIDLPEYNEAVLNPWRLAHPYMLSRGITLEAHAKLQLGYDQREHRVVFPNFWEGKLVGWQKRAIPAGQYWPPTENQMPKYRNSPGMPKSETLYNGDRIESMGGRKRIVVVESPMSVAKSVSVGLIKAAVVATFGAKVSQQQIDLLKDADEVVVWFDADHAGYAGAHKIVDGLYRHTQVRAVIPQPKIDMGDLNTADEMIAAIEGAVPAALWLADYNRRT